MGITIDGFPLTRDDDGFQRVVGQLVLAGADFERAMRDALDRASGGSDHDLHRLSWSKFEKRLRQTPGTDATRRNVLAILDDVHGCKKGRDMIVHGRWPLNEQDPRSTRGYYSDFEGNVAIVLGSIEAYAAMAERLARAAQQLGDLAIQPDPGTP